jgi:ATP-dependent exoDNAse (exonuclease V) beta subunit
MSITGVRWLKEKQKNEHNSFFSEVIVYSKELGIAGTIDLLVYNSEQNMYHLVDWKTNKRIDKNSFRNKKGILSSSKHLDDCNFMHYSLQLSFYRYILERYYGLEVGSQTLFHLKENDSYEIFNVEYKSEDLINMLREKELI